MTPPIPSLFIYLGVPACCPIRLDNLAVDRTLSTTPLLCQIRNYLKAPR